MGRPTGVGQQNPCLRLCHGPDVLSEHLIGLYFDATAPDAQPRWQVVPVSSAATRNPGHPQGYVLPSDGSSISNLQWWRI